MDYLNTQNLDRAHIFHPWTTQGPQDLVPVIERGEGCYFWDTRGRKYLDFLAQLFNLNLGHGNLRVIHAIQQQAEKLCALNPTFTSEPRAKLGELLAEITPGDLTKTFLTNSGSEANEMAFQMARMVTGRQKILARLSLIPRDDHRNLLRGRRSATVEFRAGCSRNRAVFRSILLPMRLRDDLPGM